MMLENCSCTLSRAVQAQSQCCAEYSIGVIYALHVLIAFTDHTIVIVDVLCVR